MFCRNNTYFTPVRGTLKSFVLPPEPGAGRPLTVSLKDEKVTKFNAFRNWTQTYDRLIYPNTIFAGAMFEIVRHLPFDSQQPLTVRPFNFIENRWDHGQITELRYIREEKNGKVSHTFTAPFLKSESRATYYLDESHNILQVQSETMRLQATSEEEAKGTYRANRDTWLSRYFPQHVEEYTDVIEFLRH